MRAIFWYNSNPADSWLVIIGVLLFAGLLTWLIHRFIKIRG
jgi:hypothetical protein